ncbi:MAG: hypothetical protein ACJA1R_000553 [Flavobacteriales bacterium]|jgi:hypothetical protein
MMSVSQRACALLSLGLLACVPEVAEVHEEVSAEALVTDSYALVQLVSWLPRDGDVSTVGTEIAAHFVEATALERADALHALGVWEPVVASGCVVVAAPQPTDIGASIALVDQGVLMVDGNGQRAEIVPRSVPAYIPQLKGVVYGVDAAGPPGYAPNEPYTVWTELGDDLDARGGVVEAPGPVEIIAIDGRELGSASDFTYDPSDGLDVELLAASDIVYLSLRSGSTLRAARIECRLEKESALRLSAEALDALFPTMDSIELTVRTVSSAPLAGEGPSGRLDYFFGDRVALSPLPRP